MYIQEELYRTGIKKSVYTNSKACKHCTHKKVYTTNKRGRKLYISENEDILKEHIKKHSENTELYKTRQMIVEHVFGTIKKAFGYTHFLLRGNEKVKGKSFMHFLIYNKRLFNIKDINTIIEAIKI